MDALAPRDECITIEVAVAGFAKLVDLPFSDFVLAGITRMEDNLSKAKGKKEKEKLKNQTKGKKQTAANQKVKTDQS